MSAPYWSSGVGRERLLAVALGEQPADLAIRGGRLVDVHTGEIRPADVAVADGRIAVVGDVAHCVGERTTVVDAAGRHLVPGLIDTHVHVGPFGLTMTELARLLVPLGTVALVTDFYEPALAAGVEAARFLLDEAAGTPLNVALSPFCPAFGDHDSIGGIAPAAFEQMLGWPECREVREWWLERENAGDNAERRIGELARETGVLLCGHLAGLAGHELQAAAALGIHSDHEAADADEALARARLGIAVQMRWSSGSRDELAPLLRAVTEHGCDPRLFMFSTDEEDLEDVMELGYIDHRVRFAIAHGVAPLDAIRMGSLNAAVHLRATADLGSVAPGRLAFVNLVEDLAAFRISTVVAGDQVVGEDGRWVGRPLPAVEHPASFRDTVNVGRALTAGDFRIPAPGANGSVSARVIVPRSHGWDERARELTVRDGALPADPGRDLAKVAVVERRDASGRIGLGLLEGFGLARGAFATCFHPIAMGSSSISLGIGVVGVDDADMALAVNRVAELQGGFVAVDGGEVVAELPLPLLGYLTAAPVEQVKERFGAVRAAIAELGCTKPGLYTLLGYLMLPVSPGLHVTADGLISVGARFTQETVPVLIE